MQETLFPIEDYTDTGIAAEVQPAGLHTVHT